MQNKELELMSTAVRFLSIEMVAKANSGHPGLPLGFADVATVLFANYLKFVPTKPLWADRDRFILSAGHGSALLYSLFHLSGYEDCTIDEIKNFRQLFSKTAGHPEYGNLKAIETTTGPLGQGIANAVGMAIAERNLNTNFGDEIVNHKTYCMVGDGCLMEGISYEALSLAGHLSLKNLIILFDNNEITIDGKTNITRTENIKMRMESINFKYIEVDGHNFDSIKQALDSAQNSQQPVFISFKTKIGYKSTKEGSNKCHGSPLKDNDLLITKKNLGCANWDAFEVPKEIISLWNKAIESKQDEFINWKQRAEKSNKFEEFSRLIKGEFSENWKNNLKKFKEEIIKESPNESTRKSSQRVLEILTKDIKQLIGGSADLTGSVLTQTSSLNNLDKNNYQGRYINYGVREHAMAAIMNGIALHKGFVPYAGTFFCFADYEKPAIRLSALMEQQVLYILTHDSIGLGEDGPTHQPIEQLAMLRSVPNLNVFRPCDLQETIDCYEIALENKYTPSALVFSRQNVNLIKNKSKENLVKKGAYFTKESEKAIITLISTGTEVELAMNISNELLKKNLLVNVVSAPCLDIFDKQSLEYKNKIINKNTLRVAIEAASSYGWHKYLGDDGLFFGIAANRFGISAPAEEIYKYFGLTVENIVGEILKKINK